eukprot:8630739-Lingulodinium_polyedra.AAC.1
MRARPNAPTSSVSSMPEPLRSGCWSIARAEGKTPALARELPFSERAPRCGVLQRRPKQSLVLQVRSSSSAAIVWHGGAVRWAR